MALLDSKQLNPKLTGSFILSGSTQTFYGASDFQGSITASGDISASGIIIADTFQSTGGDDQISFEDNLSIPATKFKSESLHTAFKTSLPIFP